MSLRSLAERGIHKRSARTTCDVNPFILLRLAIQNNDLPWLKSRVNRCLQVGPTLPVLPKQRFLQGCEQAPQLCGALDGVVFTNDMPEPCDITISRLRAVPCAISCCSVSRGDQARVPEA